MDLNVKNHILYYIIYINTIKIHDNIKILPNKLDHDKLDILFNILTGIIINATIIIIIYLLFEKKGIPISSQGILINISQEINYINILYCINNSNTN